MRGSLRIVSLNLWDSAVSVRPGRPAKCHKLGGFANVWRRLTGVMRCEDLSADLETIGTCIADSWEFPAAWSRGPNCRLEAAKRA